MEEKLDFSKVPYRYPLCLNQQCPRANTCLRQIAEQSAPDEIQSWPILRPKHLESLKGDCPYYVPYKKLRYAQGFIGILDEIPRKQAQEVINKLMSHFDRRTYYRVRKGERLLSPSEQQEVIAILKRCGIRDSRDFDAYVEDYDWN